MLKKIADFDNRVSVYWTNRKFSKKTERFLKFYVRLGDGYIWAAFAVFLFVNIGFAKFWPVLVQALIAVGVALGLYEIIKLNTKRLRPFMVNPKIKAEVPPMDKFSFPSGHTMNNLAVASAVTFCEPSYGWIMMLLPFSWGLLRVYFGVHWLTDVICGFLFGIFAFAISHFIWMPIAYFLGI